MCVNLVNVCFFSLKTPREISFHWITMERLKIMGHIIGSYLYWIYCSSDYYYIILTVLELVVSYVPIITSVVFISSVALHLEKSSCTLFKDEHCQGTLKRLEFVISFNIGSFLWKWSHREILNPCQH